MSSPSVHDINWQTLEIIINKEKKLNRVRLLSQVCAISCIVSTLPLPPVSGESHGSVLECVLFQNRRSIIVFATAAVDDFQCAIYSLSSGRCANAIRDPSSPAVLGDQPQGRRVFLTPKRKCQANGDFSTSSIIGARAEPRSFALFRCICLCRCPSKLTGRCQSLFAQGQLGVLTLVQLNTGFLSLL